MSASVCIVARYYLVNTHLAKPGILPRRESEDILHVPTDVGQAQTMVQVIVSNVFFVLVPSFRRDGDPLIHVATTVVAVCCQSTEPSGRCTSDWRQMNVGLLGATSG